MVFNFFANATEGVSWVPNPTNRGTSNILQSCLITTSLCVWTALHLNLKEHDDPTFLRISYQTWRKAGWLMIGLLAPELVVYTAWFQRSEAKEVTDMYNKRFGLELPPGKLKRAYRWLFHRQGKESTSTREDLSIELEAAQNPNQTSATARHDKIPWSLAQGFYAQMGGFALDTIGAYPEILPEVRTTIDRVRLRSLLKHRRPPLPATHQNTTNKDKKTDKSPSSARELLHQEQGDEVREQEIHKVELALAKNAPNEERPEAKAPVESDESDISDVDWETSDYSFYKPLNISKKDLQDKSKANGLAKALVCLQASWFCVQCLVRVGQALPVTLLEINTFAHSICALLVYILWWDKPLDVEQPTYLPVQGIHAVSRWSAIERYSYTTRFIEYLPVLISDLKNKVCITPVPAREEQAVVSRGLSLRDEFSKEVPSEFKKFISEAEAVKPDGTTYPGILICDPASDLHSSRVSGTWWPYPNTNISSCICSCYPAHKNLTEGRWKIYGSFLDEEALPAIEKVNLTRRSVRVTRVPNWPSFNIRKPWIQFLFLFVAFIYGGLHSLAWNALFPSQTQRLLWQMSSSIIMGAGVPALICYFLSEDIYVRSIIEPRYGTFVSRWRAYTFRLSKPILNYRLLCILRGTRYPFLNEIRKNRMENDTTPLPVIWKELPFLYDSIDKLLFWIIPLLLPAYFFARIYLVVESFVQLFHLEPGPVFKQPLWSSYIPHLG